MPNDTLSFRPDDRQQRLILMYQKSKQVKKSDAVKELVDLGLRQHFGGMRDVFLLELAKVAMGAAIALTFVWWYTGVGRFFTYLFWGLAFASVLVHWSPYGWQDALDRALNRSESKPS